MSAAVGTTSRTVHRTPYEHRLDLVTAVLRDRTKLDVSAARSAAARVLHRIDTIPEHMR